MTNENATGLNFDIGKWYRVSFRHFLPFANNTNTDTLNRRIESREIKGPRKAIAMRLNMLAIVFTVSFISSSSMYRSLAKILPICFFVSRSKEIDAQELITAYGLFV